MAGSPRGLGSVAVSCAGRWEPPDPTGTRHRGLRCDGGTPPSPEQSPETVTVTAGMVACTDGFGKTSEAELADESAGDPTARVFSQAWGDSCAGTEQATPEATVKREEVPPPSSPVDGGSSAGAAHAAITGGEQRHGKHGRCLHYRPGRDQAVGSQRFTTSLSRRRPRPAPLRHCRRDGTG